MIGEHLWKDYGSYRRKWHSKEQRKCLKCGSTVMFVREPRCGSRIYCTMTKTGEITTGAMSRCET